AVDGQFRNFHPAAKDQPVHFNPASATSIPATASQMNAARSETATPGVTVEDAQIVGSRLVPANAAGWRTVTR
ncbi:hypothetical protein, partial [Rhodococcus qingshengii]|uniref:hypothetical protein n=1 Tax=Rhodococcus qingshengii TaxID=334542 RepID=UPI003700979D